MLRRAAIVAPVRTPVAKYLGALKDIPAEALAAHVIKATVARSGIDPARIEDVVFAQSYANSEAPCIGRWAALAADLPIEVPGYQVDRRCGGGLQAIVTAAMMVETGAADAVIAGGVESMSNIEYYTTSMRSGARAGNVQLYDRLERGRERSQPVERFGVISGMIETAENVARQCQITREASDAFAAESHRRAARAQANGTFAGEIVPVPVAQRKGDHLLIAKDEGVRADTTAETLGALKPIIKGGVVTAGNSSQQNDAAAACLVVAEDKLAAPPPAVTRRRWVLVPFQRWQSSSPEPRRAGKMSISSNSTKPSRRKSWACSKAGAGTIATSSTSTAPAFRSATRSAPLARAF